MFPKPEERAGRHSFPVIPALGYPANDPSGPGRFTGPAPNMFITRGFDWSDTAPGRRRWANALLGRLGIAARLTAPGSTGYQTSVEQRANIYHLVSQVLAYGVEGALVEFGPFTGTVSTLIERVVSAEGAGQEVHVYDSFGPAFGVPDPLEALKQNFASLGLSLPIIHAGPVRETLPAQLPDKIAFALIDIGFGGYEHRAAEHSDDVCFVLGHVYPRLSRGAICTLIDFWDPRWHTNEVHENPGVTLACDRFFADKPERVAALYGGSYTQGYFRKL
jgi:O-methyltransferase